MKKIIAALLCAVLLAVMPVVSAATVYTEGYFEYRVEDGGIVICGYFGSDSEVTVPSSIAGYPVSVIGTGAFSDCGGIRKINLPDTIMKIEEGAVSGSQTVVYNSNTDQETVREPKPTPVPTKAPAATRAPSGIGGNTGFVQDGDGYAPQAPEMTQAPEASQSPEASRNPEVSENPEETAAPEAGSTDVVTAAPQQTEEPAVSDDVFSEEADELIADAVFAQSENDEQTVIKSDADDKQNADPDQAEAETEPDAQKEKLTITPVEQNQRGGWVIAALGALAGVAVLAVIILLRRKKYGNQ